MSKSYEFDDLLEGVSTRLQAQHGGGDEIDEMVRRNIEDAVKAAELGSGGAGTSFLDEHGGSYLGEEEAGFKARGQRPASGASSAGRRGSSAGAGAGGPGSGVASCLDVPGHADATVRLHKARIRGLEDEVEKLGSALSERDRQLAAAKKDVKAVKAEQATWAKTQKGLEAQIEKLKKAAVDEREAALAREAAIKEQAREGSRTDKERTARDAESRARDVRLTRALEEVEKYKALLSDVRMQEREGRDVVKGDASKLASENKRLERQRAELLVAFKKQLKLIDVLKRQKLHLEAARALQFTEQEFLQTLEMGSA